MSIQKSIQVSHKGIGNPVGALLPVLLLLILSACGGPNIVILHSGLSNEAPAILDVYCGVLSRVLHITDDSGRLIYNNDDWTEEDWHKQDIVHKFELKPGQYSISYKMTFSNTERRHDEFTIQVKSGHLYKFAGYFVMHEEGWIWIEDVTTSEVVAGIPPPRGVKKKWGNHHAYCRSTVLDYL